jgi:hypothetical protein
MPGSGSDRVGDALAAGGACDDSVRSHLRDSHRFDSGSIRQVWGEGKQIPASLGKFFLLPKNGLHQVAMISRLAALAIEQDNP